MFGLQNISTSLRCSSGSGPNHAWSRDLPEKVFADMIQFDGGNRQVILRVTKGLSARSGLVMEQDAIEAEWGQ